MSKRKKIKVFKAKRVIKNRYKKSSIRHSVREPILPVKIASLASPTVLKTKNKTVAAAPVTHTKQKIQLNTLQPIKCKKKKAYKKQMLKSIAAQVAGSGKSMQSWRKERAKNRTIIWEC